MWSFTEGRKQVICAKLICHPSLWDFWRLSDSCTQRQLLTIPDETPNVTVPLAPNQTMDRNWCYWAGAPSAVQERKCLAKICSDSWTLDKLSLNIYLPSQTGHSRIPTVRKGVKWKKREGIPQHLKVCDICFKYLVNEKKCVYLPCTLAWSLCVFKCLGIALP